MAFVHFVQICDKTELMTLGYAHLQQKPQLTDERSTNTTPQTVGHAGHNRQLDAAAPLETIQWSSSPPTALQSDRGLAVGLRSTG